jgi:hypothetical protein
LIDKENKSILALLNKDETATVTVSERAPKSAPKVESKAV